MKKIAFVDRDGTLIEEPPDYQVDRLDKIVLVPMVIPSLRRLLDEGFRLVMVTNQDDLGTPKFPQADFDRAHEFVVRLFASQGISFEEILICPHGEDDGCACRKPRLGLVQKYLRDRSIDLDRSFVVGDRITDLELATEMGIRGYRVGDGTDGTLSWPSITHQVLAGARRAEIKRTTRETSISVQIDLDDASESTIQTGIGFYDHMLEQLAKHGGFLMNVIVDRGDLHIDEHHVVEDTALALGEALRKALGDKIGIGRYGFVLPMDEARATVALDLSGRPYFVFKGQFSRDKVGEFPTELVPHFFRSLSDALGANLHLEIEGENNHHLIECAFKGVARALRDAVARTDRADIPSTKGAL